MFYGMNTSIAQNHRVAYVNRQAANTLFLLSMPCIKTAQNNVHTTRTEPLGFYLWEKNQMQ